MLSKCPAFLRTEISAVIEYHAGMTCKCHGNLDFRHRTMKWKQLSVPPAHMTNWFFVMAVAKQQQLFKVPTTLQQTIEITQWTRLIWSLCLKVLDYEYVDDRCSSAHPCSVSGRSTQNAKVLELKCKAILMTCPLFDWLRHQWSRYVVLEFKFLNLFL